MNQKQRKKNRTAAHDAYCAHLQLGYEQDFFQLDWAQPVFEALNRYATSCELTAPLTLPPQVLFDDKGHKTILVRHLHEGKQKNFCIGWPLSPQQIEAANEEFGEPETNAMKGN